jgi:hypothetical protein
LLWIAPDLARDLLAERRDARTYFLQQRDGNAFILLEQREEKMRVMHLRIAGASRVSEGVVERFGGFDGEPIGVEHFSGNGQRATGNEVCPQTQQS